MACLVLAVAMQGLLSIAVAETAANHVARCQGSDVLAELAARDPAAMARIDKAAAEIANGEANLWRVSRPGIAPSHLFGTIHLTDERVTTLSPAVTAALASARKLALEIAEISPASFAAAMKDLGDTLVFEGDRSLTRELHGDELGTARVALEGAGFPAQALDRLRPWLVTMLTAVSSCERARIKAGLKPLDFRLASLARQRGLPVIGLETIASQMRALASVPDGDQLAVLRVSLKSLSRSGDLMETMVRRYVARETAKVLPMNEELARAAGLESRAFASFHTALLSDRNPRLRDAALPLLAEGGAFVAVGALHLVGRDGLVALFREAGYEVTAVE